MNEEFSNVWKVKIHFYFTRMNIHLKEKGSANRISGTFRLEPTSTTHCALIWIMYDLAQTLIGEIIPKTDFTGHNIIVIQRAQIMKLLFLITHILSRDNISVPKYSCCLTKEHFPFQRWHIYWSQRKAVSGQLVWLWKKLWWWRITHYSKLLTLPMVTSKIYFVSGCLETYNWHAKMLLAFHQM